MLRFKPTFSLSILTLIKRLFSSSFSSVQFSQSCLTLCNPMDCSTLGFPILHNLLEFAQIHVHWIGYPISSSVIPFSSCCQSFPALASFQMSRDFASGSQGIGVSASVSVPPMNSQDWFPLGWTGWISLQSKGLPRVFSNTTVQSINSSAFNFLYSPTLTYKHDYWKNCCFD